MPTVARRYGQPQISRDALPGVRKQAAETPESEGAQLFQQQARGAQIKAQIGNQVGGGVVDMMQKERQRANEIAVTEYENQLAEKQNQLLFGDGGALTIKGKDAQGLPEKVMDEFTKYAGDLESKLGTQEQRDAARKVRLQRGQSLNLTVLRHANEQVDAYENDEYKRSVQNHITEAMQNPFDPLMIGQALQGVITTIQTHAPHLGYGPEAVDAQVRAATSEVHKGVVEQLLANHKPEMAKFYFETHQGAIDPEQKPELIKALEIGDTLEKAQKATASIMAQTKDLDAQRALAKSTLTGEVQKETLQQLEHEYALQQQRQRDKVAQIMVTGKNTIDAPGGRYENISPADIAQLSPEEATALKNYSYNKELGRPVKTVFAEQYRLKMLAVNDPEKFAQEDLTKYIDRIAPNDLDELTNIKMAIVKGDTKAAAKQLGGFMTVSQVVDQTLGEYGYNPNAKEGTKDGNAVAFVRELLNERVTAIQSKTQKELPEEDVRTMLKDILRANIDVPGAIWGHNTVSVGKMTEAQIGPHLETVQNALRNAGRPVDEKSMIKFDAELRLRFGDDIGPNAILKIPKEDVRDIAAALTARKQAATPQAIVNLYIDLLARGRVK